MTTLRQLEKNGEIWKEIKKMEVDLKKMREEAGFSAEELAAKMGMSLATIRRWERGETKPSKGNMMLLKLILERKIRRKKIKERIN